MPWTVPIPSGDVVAIHVALLPTPNGDGEILLFGGDNHDIAAARANQIDHTARFNCRHPTLAVIPVDAPDFDLFCCGQAFLGDGRLLVAGGTDEFPPDAEGIHHERHFDGHRHAAIYHPRTGQLLTTADMNPEPGAGSAGGGRWYPTLCTVENGDVFIFQGHPKGDDGRHGNNSMERYQLATNRWVLMPSLGVVSGDPILYSRLHLLSDGSIFVSSFVNGFGRNIAINPFDGSFREVSDLPNGRYHGFGCPSVLLPLMPNDGYRNRIFLCGGEQSQLLDVGNAGAGWQIVPRMGTLAGVGRTNSNATLLPTGDVVVTGGANPDNDQTSVNNPEIYRTPLNRAARTYQAGVGFSETINDPATHLRNYHSSAILMPDGRVWVAGGNSPAQPNSAPTATQKSIEIYTPPYPAGVRPQITACPSAIDYGASFPVTVSDASVIESVVLMRCGSATHSFNGDQRAIYLNFDGGESNTLTLIAPPNGRIAPPGWYMLFVVDNAGRPCEWASFVRLSQRSIHFVLDHSTFSKHEVQSMLHTSTNARFSKALYVVLDGYLRSEVGLPSVHLHYDSAAGIEIPNVQVIPIGTPEFEHSVEDVPQRITYACDVVFNDTSPFDTIDATRQRTAVAVAQFGNHRTEGTLRLTLNPNPYLVDGSVEWLSTDLRVFKIRQGGYFAGDRLLEHTGNAIGFVQTLLTRLNDGSSGSLFDSISTDINDSRLDLSPIEVLSFFPLRTVNVYNYAVAKIRYRSLAETASLVQVFFRAFQAATTDVSFNTGTIYRREGNGVNAVPLLGKSGSNQLLSIPFFADVRATGDMRSQNNNTNKKDINFDAGGQEVTVYFGCWLDINQDTSRFPNNVTSEGPFDPSQMRSIQALMRGTHQCLVAEIHYGLDPIPMGATPGNNDNLSQRNLVIDHSDNPGDQDSHIVRHPFELKPTNGYVSTSEFGKYYQNYARPDELMIHWGSLPRNSAISIYLPSVYADDVLAIQAFSRLSSSYLTKVDEHTIRCEGEADVTYIPIPLSNQGEPITGLFTVELPNNVVKGQSFNTVVQQIAGSSRRIIGSFQMLIPVSTADALLPELSQRLSILKHIQLSISPNDRWYAVFNRYVSHFSSKIKALGGNPDHVLPSTTGLGAFPNLIKESWTLCMTLQWTVTLLLAVLVVSSTLVPTTIAAIVATILVVMLLAICGFWFARCTPNRYSVIKAILLGLNIGAAVLSAVYLFRRFIDSPFLFAMIAALSLANFVLLLLIHWEAAKGSRTPKL